MFRCVDKTTRYNTSYEWTLLSINWLYMFRAITSPSSGASTHKLYNALVCSFIHKKCCISLVYLHILQFQLNDTSWLCSYVQMGKNESLSVIYLRPSGKAVPVQTLTRHRLGSISCVKFSSKANYLPRPSSCSFRSRDKYQNSFCRFGIS